MFIVNLYSILITFLRKKPTKLQMYSFTKQSKLEKCRSLDNLNGFKKRQKSIYNSPTGLKIQPVSRTNQLQYSEIDRSGVKDLKRIKSTEMFKFKNPDSSLETMLDHYKEENSNLKKQNRFLVSEIRKRKKNEEMLCNYVQHLQSQIKKLQSKNRVSPYEKVFTLSSHLSKQHERPSKSPQSKNYIMGGESSVTTLATQMQQLTYKFNNLMDQCSREQNKKVKNLLRSKIAETADRMKSFKKQFNE